MCATQTLMKLIKVEQRQYAHIHIPHNIITRMQARTTHALINSQKKWLLSILFLAGTYESGIASYKHLYFNATENTMKIWILTVIAIIALYECAKRLISLMILRSVRYSMIFLFCLSMFSHYYSWWAYLNYYNDDFYSQWNHQMFFTVNTLNLRFLIWFAIWFVCVWVFVLPIIVTHPQP